MLLQDKAEVINRKVQPTAKELADAQAAVKAKKAEVEAAKARVAEASRRFADLQKEADMEHRKAEAALSEAAQKETGLSQNILLCCLGSVILHLSRLMPVRLYTFASSIGCCPKGHLSGVRQTYFCLQMHLSLGWPALATEQQCLLQFCQTWPYRAVQHKTVMSHSS